MSLGRRFSCTGFLHIRGSLMGMYWWIRLLSRQSWVVVIRNFTFRNLKSFRNLWKSRMRQEFHEWCVSSGREKSKEFFSEHYVQKPRPWFHKWDLNGRTIVSINCLRSRHHSLRARLFRFNIVPSAICAHVS